MHPWAVEDPFGGLWGRLPAAVRAHGAEERADKGSLGEGSEQCTVPRPPPRTTGPVPRSVPQHRGHTGAPGPRGTVGLARPSRDFSLQDFPMEEDLLFPGPSGQAPGGERYPSSLRGEPRSPPEALRAALVLPLFQQSAGRAKAGMVPAAGDIWGDGCPPAPEPSRGLSPAAPAVRHTGRMLTIVPCQQGCVRWGMPSPVPPRLGEGQRKSEPRHPGAEPEWGRGTFLERMHRNKLLFQPGLRAQGCRRPPPL